jgi:hypothetical protein
LTFILLPSIGSLTLDIGSLISAHPALINDLAGHALAHALYSYVRRGAHNRRSRRENRKEMNRRRRWFVDNIVLHHKRLHDRNRAIVISDARTRALAKKKMQRDPRTQGAPDVSPNQDSSMKWRNAISLKDRGLKIRGTIDLKKSRARSRWLSVMSAKAS